MRKIVIALLLIQIFINPVQAQRVRELNEATSPGVKRNQLQLLSPKSKANLIFRILEKRMEALNKRLEKLNLRVERWLTRIETTEQNMARLKNELLALNQKLSEIKGTTGKIKTDWEAYLASPDKEKYSLIRTKLQETVKEMKTVIVDEKKLLQEIKRYKLKQVMEKTASSSAL